ncbi:hypothetical protein MAPG_04556 [Magnaporthiopsis poae ATCC 64411]|uniref:2EXR domain-containing protein n=1 Tax=Magnaporthiopsis poae (strain ATCC 64411 / 73-15) TaxID=644358 RepID=A0A0C4DX20_MAGP6|nr:hypothetical protein MAPG_04556 [Magnaporthiopsis poae ATCC 64411]
MSFSRLPFELRLQIWEDTIEDAVPQIAVWNKKRHARDPHYIPQVPVAFPVAMRVCSESREAVKKRLKFVALGRPYSAHPVARIPVRDFEPETDALFIPKDNIPSFYATLCAMGLFATSPDGIDARDLASWVIFHRTRQVVVSQEVIPYDVVPGEANRSDVVSTFLTLAIHGMEALRCVHILTDPMRELLSDRRRDGLGDDLAVRRFWIQETRYGHPFHDLPLTDFELLNWFRCSIPFRYCELAKLN